MIEMNSMEAVRALLMLEMVMVRPQNGDCAHPSLPGMLLCSVL